MRTCWLILLVVVGCSGELADPCTAAAEHVAACTGEGQVAEVASCDPDRAEAVLQQSCDELAASAAKSDGFWADLMCALGFSSYCEADAARSLSGTIHKLGNTQPIDIVLHVRAIRESRPDDVKGVFSLNGFYSLSDLAPERYRIEVSATPTSAAIKSQSVDVATQSTLILFVPLP